MATLNVNATTDFTGQNLLNIDAIVFGGNGSDATFTSSQFGAGKISNTVAIAGGTGNNVLKVNMNGATFSAAGWSFTSFVPGIDLVQISGTTGADNITGSASDDFILTVDTGIAASSAPDTIDAGAGDDSILLFLGSTAGLVVDGGTGSDTLTLNSGINYNLRTATLSGIEKLVMSQANRVDLDEDQIGLGAITSVIFNALLDQELIVFGDLVNLGAVSVGVFDPARHQIRISGDNLAFNSLTGTNVGDSIGGGTLDDVILGGDGADTMNGGGGADTFLYVFASEAQAGETVNGGAGTDTVVISGSTYDFTGVAFTSVERLEFGNPSATASFKGTQFGGSGDFTTVIGSNGVNTLIFDPSTVSAFGLNTDLSTIVFQNWTNGQDSITINGTFRNDTLIGTNQNDTLNGKAGADTMNGGNGADVYIVDNINDVVIDSGAGIDEVRASVSFTLPVPVEHLVLTGKLATDGTGNTFANRITGNSGANVLSGLGGDDTLNGGAGGDTLIGGNQNDTLNGGSGIDNMAGGLGDDFMFVDNADDLITENAGEGNDTVATSVSYVLSALAEVETLRTTSNGSTAAIDLTGNAFSQFVTGNNGKNILRGGGGEDTLNGLGGDDTIFVDSAGDVVVEGNNQGNDTVASTVSYVLGSAARVETLRTTSNGGTAAIDLTGNTFTQTIIGNAGVNTLHSGGGAADVMKGLGGNDTYRVFNSADVVEETAGNGTADKVIAAVDYVLAAGVEVETLQTNGSSGTSSIDFTGNAFAQTIVGNAGANRLDGGDGSDTINGGSGADVFVFSTALSAGNVDTIGDYNVAADQIELSLAIFSAINQAPGALLSGFFKANAAGVATDANDRIIYDTTDGRLLYDEDGNGALADVQFAILTGAPAITFNDFSVF